jgi:hypothetical protein
MPVHCGLERPAPALVAQHAMLGDRGATGTGGAAAVWLGRWVLSDPAGAAWPRRERSGRERVAAAVSSRHSRARPRAG